MIVTMPQNVCVYCASSDRVDPVYAESARATGAALGRANLGLVYGGGAVRLMGTVAKAARDAGARVTGVIPQFMIDKELAWAGADEMIVTDDMRARKAIMQDRADAFIALAGGFGTLEELIEIITYRNLRIHDKPIVLLNTNGFYDKLLRLFDQFIEQRFAKNRYMESFHVAPEPDAAMTYLTEFWKMPRK